MCIVYTHIHSISTYSVKQRYHTLIHNINDSYLNTIITPTPTHTYTHTHTHPHTHYTHPHTHHKHINSTQTLKLTSLTSTSVSVKISTSLYFFTSSLNLYNSSCKTHTSYLSHICIYI